MTDIIEKIDRRKGIRTMDQDKRINGNGRRHNDQYCPMHETIVKTQGEIKSGFKWLIALHIGEYGIIITALIGAIHYLLNNQP